MNSDKFLDRNHNLGIQLGCRIKNYRSYSISKNSSSLLLSLLACTEDEHCTDDDDDRKVCDTTRNVCVGKFNKIHFVRV